MVKVVQSVQQVGVLLQFVTETMTQNVNLVKMERHIPGVRVTAGMANITLPFHVSSQRRI
jgi:hypothetical protein